MSKLRSKRALAVVLTAGLAAVGGGGAAIAASQGDSGSPSAFFDAVAKHLGISSEKLEDATKAAAKDQVDAALKEGRITQAEADELKSRIESGEFRGFFGPGFPGGFHHHPHGFGDHLSAAASYLGLTVDQLRDRLREGQSLADVAKAEDKSVDGLKQAILDAAKKELDKAVSDEELTRKEADAILERLQRAIDNLVNGTFHGRRWGGPFDGPRGSTLLWEANTA